MKLPSFHLIEYLKKNPTRTAFVFSLVCETFILLYTAFFFLWTAKILFPGFIFLDTNFTIFFFLLMGCTLLLISLGGALGYSFPAKIPFEKPLLFVSLIWSVGLLTLSLYTFPLWSIGVLLLLLFAILYYFYTLFLSHHE